MLKGQTCDPEITTDLKDILQRSGMGTWRRVARFMERGVAIFRGRGVVTFKCNVLCTNPGETQEVRGER